MAPQAQKLLKKGVFRALKVASHGQHIYIYNNFRTNQTVYSLERSVHNKTALEQLAYAGKKTIPASIRKDTWRPMAVVTFPYAQQGLSVYRRLLELRKLHELHWDNNKEYPMLPPETAQKIKEGKIAPSKKDRAKIIMDQKANSVADLAALLKIHNDLAFEQYEKNVEGMAETIDRLHSNVAKVNEVTKEIQEVSEQLKNGNLDESARGELIKQRKKLNAKKNTLLGPDPSVEMMVERAEELVLARRAASGELEELEQEISELETRLAESTSSGEQEELRRSLEARSLSPGEQEKLRQSLEREKERCERMRRAFEKVRDELDSRQNAAARRRTRHQKKRGITVNRPDRVPLWWSRGVSIKWADVTDAAYAAEWPAEVKHDQFEHLRHSFGPDPEFASLRAARDKEAAAAAAAKEAATKARAIENAAKTGEATMAAARKAAAKATKTAAIAKEAAAGMAAARAAAATKAVAA